LNEHRAAVAGATGDTISLTKVLPGPMVDGINCPHHIFVNSDLKVACAEDPP
jgi:hypothetical protein